MAGSGYVVATPGGSSGHGPSGVTGFIGNLVHDIGDAARGLPEGIVQTAEHPIRTGENFVKATWQTWSPLVHAALGQGSVTGDLSKFGHQFYDHPLAPMLDIATVFTGGAGIAAKLGTGLERAGMISADSGLAKLGSLPTKVDITGAEAGRGANAVTRTKYLPSNPIHNVLYRKAMDAASSDSSIPSWFLHPMSKSSVYGRLEKVDWAHSGLALRAQMAAMMKAGEVFNKAGHSDWQYLENQLFGRNYQSLVQHSAEVPLQQIIDHGGKAPDGYTFVSKNVDTSQPLFKNGYARNVNEFANHVGSLDKKFTTRSLEDAVIVGPQSMPAGTIAPYVSKDHEVVDSLPDIATRGQRGYVYHVTNVRNLGSIRKDGLKAVEPVGAGGGKDLKGVYFTTDPLTASRLAGKTKGAGAVYLRVRKDAVPDLHLHPNKAYGELLTPKSVSRNNIEYLGEDGHWHLAAEKSALQVARESGQPAMVKVAHSRALEATMLDAKNGAHFLVKLARYPTTIWKAVTLGLSPRVIVNNGLGNWLMYAMRQGGAHSAQGFVDAVRYTRGERAAMSMLKDTGKLPAEHFLNQHFRDELGNTFGSSTLGKTDFGGGRTGSEIGSAGKDGNVLDKVIGTIYRRGFYSGVHRYSDVPVRAAAISAYLRGDPMVRGLMKSGKSFEDAASTALKSNQALRDRAALHARSVAGDYTTMSGKEQAIRDFVPFYLWDKHIAKHAINMLRDRPGTVTAGTGIGQQGANATRNQLGNVPDWMVGAIKLPFSVPGEGGRTTLLNTQGMNPYSSVPDLVGFAQALTTGHTQDSAGDTILGTVNPLIKGLVEHTMGQKATGAPITSHGGVIPSSLVDIFNSLRPVQVGRSAAGMTPPPGKNPKLYKTDINTILSALVGAPIQEADLGRAHQLAAQIANGGKKPKKGRSAYVVAG